MKPDWAGIRAHYEQTGEPLRAVAERFGVAQRTLFRRASAEHWLRHGVNGGNASNGREKSAAANIGEAPGIGSANTSENCAVGVGAASDDALEDNVAATAATVSADHAATTGSDDSAESGAAPTNGSNAASAAKADCTDGNALTEGLAPSGSSFHIPVEINGWDRLKTSQFYLQQFNWAVHPLCQPEKGPDKERGKKPVFKGWKNHRAADVAIEDLAGCFGPDSKYNYNLGVVVRPPFVAVDLDSKPDKGASVMAWLAERPHLSAVPRERTAGGAHLHFICRDVPEALLNARKPPTAQLNEQVSAELYVNGCNLVVAPSIHKSGHHYVWEVTGEIPEVPWGLLGSWFGFSLPEEKKPGARWDPAKWWLRYSGDLRTLDMPGLCGELGWLGACLDVDAGKYAVRCPWSDQHSNSDPDGQPGSDAVIFEALPTLRKPAFKCQHAHCSERTIEHFLDAAEKVAPGIVNRRCSSERARGRVKMAPVELPLWLVPDGKDESAVSSIRKLGVHIAPHHSMFIMNAEVVRLLNHRRQPYCTKRKDEEVRDDYATQVLVPPQFITAIESYCRPSFLAKNEDGEMEAFGTVLKESQAKFILASAEFADALPQLNRVLRSPIPVQGAMQNELVFATPGYNPDTSIFLAMDAIQARPLPPTNENVLWAKAVLAHLLAYGRGDSFAYATPQDECHSFARFLTPFCRGLMNWAKGPLWTFEADDPGTGKDTLADVTHVQQTGSEIGYSPTKDTEEMRKAITSFLLNGGSFFHLGNIRGVFKSAPFEQASSATRMHCDRLLGESRTLRLRNEAEYSFSANDAVFTPDILRRCRRIFQRCKGNVNKRKFRIRGIIGWTYRNRPLVATAALTLVQAYWKWRAENGESGGAAEFSSFIEWADIVGGFCIWAGFGNPTCDHLLDTARRDIGAPDANEDLEFLRLLHEHTRGEWLKHGEVMDSAEQNAKDVLHSLVWDKEATWKRQLGRKLAKLNGKERGPFKLECRGGQHHQSRAEYRVVRLREGDGDDNDDPPSFVGDWYRVPPVPCLDDCGNVALPHLASRLCPVAEPSAATVSVGLPVMPVFLDQSTLLNAGELITGKNGGNNGSTSKSSGISAQKDFRVDGAKKRGITGTLLTAYPADLPERITAAGMVALDLETCGPGRGDALDPWRGEIRLFQLAITDQPPLLIDIRAAGAPPPELRAALESAVVMGHNVAFDALWLRVNWGLSLPRVYCTLTASRLLHAGDRTVRHDLDSVLQRHLRIQPPGDKPSMQKADWGGLLLPDMLAYAARDVMHLEALSAMINEELEKAGLAEVAALEMKLRPAVTEIEAAGIAVDREKLQGIQSEAAAEAERHAAELRKLLESPKLNVGSPMQLVRALNEKGMSVKSTDEEALKEASDGTIIPLILNHRAAEKLAQQAASLLDCIKGDGRIHGRFDPTGTATGRFSSKEPNLQNIGRGELRSCFVPAPGHKLIVADYSQIELRVAAALAGETRMIEAYKSGVDLHRQTAAALLNKPAQDVTSAERQLAKASAFGLLYGQSAPGLVRYAASAYGVPLTLEEATVIRRTFFETYGNIRQWHGESHQRAETGIKEVRTVTGRRRLVPDTASDWERFTALVNTPVQGGAADGMKCAIIQLSQALPPEARMISTVHDELIVEVPDAIAQSVCDQVSSAMRESMSELFPTVPIEVEAHVCNNWGEK